MTELPTSRQYQTELLKHCMAHNTIIALPTGTGKTHIAILRIKHHLDNPNAKVGGQMPSYMSMTLYKQPSWFLCPTIALCGQQHAVIKAVISKVGLVSGNLQPEKWTSQELWTGLLSSHNVIVSTPQVLLDSLTHGYIDLGRNIGLIVFDEAHHASKDEPYNQIMQTFYHRLPVDQKPSILGLTASPVSGNHVEKLLRNLEENLDAKIRVPLLHSDELSQFTFTPILRLAGYQPPWDPFHPPPAPHNVLAVKTVVQNMDIEDDPWIIQSRQRLAQEKRGSPRYAKAEQKLAKTIVKRDTYSHRNLEAFCRTGEEIHEDLGKWAAEHYVELMIERVYAAFSRRNSHLGQLDEDERVYLGKSLDAIRREIEPGIAIDASNAVSPKVSTLIDALIREKEECESLGLPFVGLLLVTRRDTVVILKSLLSLHALTVKAFRCGVLVGLSANTRRTSLFDLSHLQKDYIKEYQDTLDRFRVGEINLLLATSVAEEGVDIQACRSVFRFDRPPNLQSWVQSQGRARQQRSTFTLIVDETCQDDFKDWKRLSEEIAKACKEDRDKMRLDDSEELYDENEEEYLEFAIAETGARLTLPSAIAHLEHFCAAMPSSAYCSHRPVYEYDPDQRFFLLERGAIAHNPPMGPYLATVSLPVLLPPHLRSFTSPDWQRTKWLAKRHAAFVACVALYNAGLLNNHLLPFSFPLETDRSALDEMLKSIASREGVVNTVTQFRPWQIRLDAQRWFSCSIHIDGLGHFKLFSQSRLLKFLPNGEMDIYHGDGLLRKVSIRYAAETTEQSLNLDRARQTSRSLFWGKWGGRMSWSGLDFAYLVMPLDDTEASGLAVVDETTLLVPGSELLTSRCSAILPALGKRKDGTLLMLRSITHLNPSELDMVALRKRYPDIDESAISPPFVEASYVSRRANFLVPSISEAQMAKESRVILLMPWDIDAYCYKPSTWQASLILPSVVEHVSHLMIVEQFRRDVINGSGLENIAPGLLLEALTAPGAVGLVNYERLETLGDSILKFATSTCLLEQHEYWHEGYLSHAKDHIVSNGTLAKASLDMNLGRFVIRKPFRGRKWAPEMLQKDENDENTSSAEVMLEELSSKMLADVVEALIGASFVHIGLPGSVVLLKTVLHRDDLHWKEPRISAEAIFSRTAILSHYPKRCSDVERMVGYTFRNKTHLLEALTHASHQQPQGGTVAYERLEFLGDALLDFCVVTKFFEETSKGTKPGQLHHYKIATVNADLLGYLSYSICCSTSAEVVVATEGGFVLEKKDEVIRLWECIFHSSSLIMDHQQACSVRCQRMKNRLDDSLENGVTYPWGDLKGLILPKLFGDVVESLLGAIYIDSGGDMTVVFQFLERIGVVKLMKHFVADNVDLRHPISRINEWAALNDISYGYLFSSEDGKTCCSLVANQEALARVEIIGTAAAVQEAARLACAEKALESLNVGDAYTKKA